MPVELFWLILLLLWGACVGSFLNVVIHRVPAGLSVVSPPSRCPGCERKLALYDNVPVLGWFWLRGRCRYCRMKISRQYPIIEAVTAALFAATLWVYYCSEWRPVFSQAGIEASWPVLAVHLILLASMIAATVIDAKFYIIPLSLPWIAATAAVVSLPLSVAVGWVPQALVSPAEGFPLWEQLVPSLGGTWVAAVFGAAAGLIVAVCLLKAGLLPLSFEQEPDLPVGADPHDPAHFFTHPHPRREVGKELLFLALPVIGAAAGYVIGQAMDSEPRGAFWRTLAGVLCGYLVGGGVVWATRIFGTMLFGKEAMGLGDVHLMAAVGAVLGWRDVTLAFFIAPFFGLAAAALLAGLSALLKGRVRVIPYGPYLCGATLVVMYWRNPILAALFP